MRRGFVKSVLALPLLVLTHICYGIGFWRGLFTKVTRGQMSMPTEVVLEQISL
jgi:hypothetical protein